MSSTNTPSMTRTFSATSTMSQELIVTPDPAQSLSQSSQTTLVIFVSLLSSCFVLNLIMIYFDKKRRLKRRAKAAQANTIIAPHITVVHDNPLREVYRANV